MRSALAYTSEHALNAVCPYFTMFPLEYPLKILRNHPADKVVDPFCGRGTTVYAARIKGVAVVGVDISPIAVAIAGSKLSTIDGSVAVDLASKILERRAR